VSPDGSQVYVTGTSKGLGSDFDYSTVAYDAATGKRLWVERYDGPRSSWDQVHSLGVSPDGSSVYVTGTSRGEGTFRDYATVAYDADTGERVWVKRYDGPASYRDEARALGVSPDGSEIYVTGYSGASKSTYDYVTVAYGASTGTRLWQKRYDGPAGADDYGQALAVGPDGSAVYVTGASRGSGTLTDYATVGYRAA
jgi:DNA-binding beta-propeller fold protein YncE